MSWFGEFLVQVTTPHVPVTLRKTVDERDYSLKPTLDRAQLLNCLIQLSSAGEKRVNSGAPSRLLEIIIRGQLGPTRWETTEDLLPVDIA